MHAVVETTVAPLYRRLRRLKNRVQNRFDAPLLILAYHRVAHLDSDPHQLAVTPEHFRAQMEYLRDHCRCVRLDDDRSVLRTPAVAVTFDDGYADNLHQALPILTAAGIPATFFICTGSLDASDAFWSDELARLLLQPRTAAATFALRDRGYGGCWPTGSAAERARLHTQLHRTMLRIDPLRRTEWLAQLRRWQGGGASSAADDRPLTREELRRLAADPLVTIGAHGVSHTPLAILDAAAQRRELEGSKAELEALLEREVTLFSYPFGGRGEFDRTTRRLCREAGFHRAVTTFPGQVHRWSDPWRLPRQLVRNWDAATFAAKLEAFWTA